MQPIVQSWLLCVMLNNCCLPSLLSMPLKHTSLTIDIFYSQYFHQPHHLQHFCITTLFLLSNSHLSLALSPFPHVCNKNCKITIKCQFFFLLSNLCFKHGCFIEYPSMFQKILRSPEYSRYFFNMNYRYFYFCVFCISLSPKYLNSFRPSSQQRG